MRLHTDSQYVQKGISVWIHDWKRRGWRTADKKPVKNVDLWQQLDALQAQHDIEWIWVKGHAGHPGNERADECKLAGDAGGVASNGRARAQSRIGVLTMRQMSSTPKPPACEVVLGHRIIEIGAVEIVNRRLTDRHFHRYLNPEREIELGALEVHGLTRIPAGQAEVSRGRAANSSSSSGTPS